MTERSHAFATTWGATLDENGRARFRLWAPGVDALALRVDGLDRQMEQQREHWFELDTDDLVPGVAYSYVLPDGTAVPDPAARAQIADVHGPSRLVDPRSYRWNTDWTGRGWHEAVIYELHVGTFTEAGTFAAAQNRLGYLADTGVTAIELMPVAQFSGERGWGYDGVLPYAPHPRYGTPNEMKALIDNAHSHGLMVLLDVVYNHFGPDGNYLHLYAEEFFDASRETPWGISVAYQKDPVRRFFIENALFWLTEYQLDGLRLDAIDQILDSSEPDILMEIAERVRAEITSRPIHLTTEDDRNATHLHERSPDSEVVLYTAEWNDDFHNAAHVIATGESDGYFQDFTGDAWKLLSRALAEGFAYQGQVAAHRNAPRGQPSGHLPPTAFIDFLQNHDQTGNRAFGERLTTLSNPAMLCALRAILLLSPHIPLLFMGEEYGERRPFCYFTAYEGELADAVRNGRQREFAEFTGFTSDGVPLPEVPDPNEVTTFEASMLDWQRCSSPEGQAVLAETRRLLALRREHVVPLLDGAGGDSGTVLASSTGAIAVDWRLANGLLKLRANLGDQPQALIPASGYQIFATSPGDSSPAPAHYVAIFLEEDQ